jgi:hypothetical protein
MRKTMMIVVSGGGGCGRQKLAQLTQLNLKWKTGAIDGGKVCLVIVYDGERGRCWWYWVRWVNELVVALSENGRHRQKNFSAPHINLMMTNDIGCSWSSSSHPVVYPKLDISVRDVNNIFFVLKGSQKFFKCLYTDLQLIFIENIILILCVS